MPVQSETLLEFPCPFPVKAMGRAEAGFEAHILELIERHVSEIPSDGISRNLSRNGRYLSVTVTITAQSQDQLDAIYRDLSDCEQVLMAL